MSDLARQRLKEIRTLQGFEAAYRAAGLPQDGAKRNTQVKRLSRLINRETGGFKELDSKQKRRINRTYRRPSRQRALNEAKADRFVREENKRRLELRRRARRIFGANGTNPNPDRLRRRLEQFRPLGEEEKDRFKEALEQADRDSGIAARREYAKSLNRFQVRDLPEAERFAEVRRRTKAERAVWRDSDSQLTFKEWNAQTFEEKYGE